MKRPKKIRVGPYTFNVENMTKDDALAHAVTGRTQGETCRIFLCEDLADPVVRDTLLHETLHAAFYSFGLGTSLGFDDETEERLVTILSPILLGILKENPKLVAYLTSKGPGE